MKAGGGHRKGASFERKICKELSLWISHGARDDIFWRTAMSGGRATIGLASGIFRASQAGDVSAIDALGARLLNHVVVELKSYSDLGLFTGIVNDTGKLHGFWHELKALAVKFNKQPLLIARQNGMPTVCLLSSSSSFLLFGLTVDHVSALLPRWDCHLVLFECFLREAKIPDPIVKLQPPPRRVLLSQG